MHRPGNTVPQSGIYRVDHDVRHTQPHEVTAIQGETFPPCRNCGHGVTYTLIRAALHISGREAAPSNKNRPPGGATELPGLKSPSTLPGNPRRNQKGGDEMA